MKLIFLFAFNALMLVSKISQASEDILLHPKDILRVYDGDTFYVNIPHVPAIFGADLGIRLLGIDTPESRSVCEKAEDRAAERAKATEARIFLENLLYESVHIELRELGRDKYFRLDAKVFADDVDVSALMVEKGYAIPYDGGTKTTWCGRR